MAFFQRSKRPAPVSENEMLLQLRKALSVPTPVPEQELTPCFSIEGDDAVVGFVSRFTKAGGKLFYCVDEQSVSNALWDIQKSTACKTLGCCNDNMVSFVSNLGIQGAQKATPDADYHVGLLLSEGLIAWNASVVLSDALGFGSQFLTFPLVTVVVAFTSQVVNDWESLYLKLAANKKMPATTIVSPATNCFATGANKLYLILLEDL